MTPAATLPPSGVAHFFSAMDLGGAELRTVDVVNRIHKSFDFYATSGKAGKLDDALTSAGHRVFHLRMRLFGLFALGRAIRRNRYRVVHCNLGPASGPILMLAALSRVPVRIAHFRSDGTGGVPSVRRSIALRVSRWLINIFATRIVGVSPSSLGIGWRKDWKSDLRCAVIPNGVDAAELRERAAENASARPAWDESLVVINVGRAEPAKNRGRAIEIWRDLASKTPSTLYLVGSLDPRDNDLALAVSASMSGSSRLVVVGESFLVPEILGRAHVLITTSMREGLPGVVLEALAVGVPVVGSDLPGTEWIASQIDGTTVLSLSENDDEWASALIAAAHASRNEIRSSFDRGPFTIDNVVPIFEDLWDLSDRGQR
jgi:glycosyltransferase involved in cell wall biosynthesis